MSDPGAQAISKEILFGVVNVLVPDQPGHLIRRGIPGSEVWLNPQPLPPREGPLQDPWRAVAVSRAIITTATLALSVAQNAEDGLRAARSTLDAFVDEFCSTGRLPRVPLPPPWPRVDVRPNALDLLIAAAQLDSASSALEDHPLSDELRSSAGRLFDAAIERISR